MNEDMTTAIAVEYTAARKAALFAWVAANCEAERLWEAYQAAIDAAETVNA